jgi:glycosyltransferase involved in cell wall biosynthesis
MMHDIHTPYLFCIGRLVQEKGFDIIIEAYAKIIAAGFDLSLVIAGEGSEKHIFVEKAKELQLAISENTACDLFPNKTVCFVGNVKGQIKTSLFMRSRMVLFPTQSNLVQESFALVPFEAFAAKRPLVMSQLDRAHELKEEGFIFDIIENPSDANEWRDMIIKKLNETESLDGLNNNFQKLQPYDWKIIVEQYKTTWQKSLLLNKNISL